MKFALGFLMKFALGFLTCCILVIVGTVVFAPEHAHEIINRFHDIPTHTTKPQQTEINNESDSSAGTNRTTIVTTPITTTPVEKPLLTTTPIYTTPIEYPRTRKEMLEWLKENGYSVVREQGSYRISWRMFNRTASKPIGLISRNGKVDPHYGSIGVGNRVSNGNINGNNVNQEIIISDRPITFTNNGITAIFSIKYENGWGLETKRSFLWIPSQDNIKGVWSKAKKIKGE